MHAQAKQTANLGRGQNTGGLVLLRSAQQIKGVEMGCLGAGRGDDDYDAQHGRPHGEGTRHSVIAIANHALSIAPQRAFYTRAGTLERS